MKILSSCILKGILQSSDAMFSYRRMLGAFYMVFHLLTTIICAAILIGANIRSNHNGAYSSNAPEPLKQQVLLTFAPLTISYSVILSYSNLLTTIFKISSTPFEAFRGSFATLCQTSPCLGSLRIHLAITSSRFSCESTLARTFKLIA